MSDAARARARASARLGSTLRSVLVSPATGFASAVQAADRRERTHRATAEGLTPYVLAAASGAAGALLWLKLAGMAGLRDVATSEYRWTLLGAVAAGGAAISLLAQGLWGVVGPPLCRRLNGLARARDLRLAWGLAGFPQAFVLAALLPLDLLIVGPGAFTTDPLGDSLATAWAALSIALHLAAALWSLALFYRGLVMIASLSRRSALAATIVAAVLSASVAGVLLGVAIALAGGSV